MRKLYPEYGSERIVSGFLWLPMRLGKELGWWERVAWIEVYNQWHDGCTSMPVEGWQAERWA